jgi:hypothetical protein
MLARNRDFSRNPQDLVTRDDLAAFLQGELGIDLETSERMIAWLLHQQYLVERTSSYYDGNRGEVVVRRHYRHGPAFRVAQRPMPVPLPQDSSLPQHQPQL